MTTHILGIDPGLSGALVLVHTVTQALIVTDIPTKTVKSKTVMDPEALAVWFDINGSCILRAAVEVVTSRPRQAGQLQMGVNVGVIHGLLYASNIRFRQVSSSAWKGWFNLKRDDLQSYRDMKNVSRALAADQWPDQADLFKRVRDDGRAEAALIALYELNQGDDK